jgi:protein-S-isoprenylcysteine O-methyltransferase Ste14
MSTWRVQNLPVPEASLAGIAVGAALEQVRPWGLPGSRSVRRLVGWPIVAAGSIVVARSLKAAGSTDLAAPERLVTTGPYALSRNPMYVGWALLQLGIGVAAGSGWVLATLPLVGAAVHRDVVREERRLEKTSARMPGTRAWSGSLDRIGADVVAGSGASPVRLA